MIAQLFFAFPFLLIIAIARSHPLGDWDDIIIAITLVAFIFLRAVFQ